MTTIKLTKKRLNPELEIQGIVLTMYDGRTNFWEQVAAAEVEKFFGSSVYKTRIPRNVRIAEAPSHGEPVTASMTASPRAAGPICTLRTSSSGGRSERGSQGWGTGLDVLFGESIKEEKPPEGVSKLPIAKVRTAGQPAPVSL